MRKHILFFMALFLSAGTFAQYNKDEIERHNGHYELNEWYTPTPWRYGIKAGVSFSEISDFGFSSNRMKSGFYAGVFTEYLFNYWLGVQAEVLYSTQGNKYRIDDVSLKNRLDYINVPILAKFYIADRFSIDFGPQFGFLTHKKVNISDPRMRQNSREDVRTFDFSISIGTTYTFYNFDLSVRYNLGLTDVFKNLPETNRNGVIQFGLGYRF